MRWGVVWTDHGRALPLDQVFAAHLGQVKQRLGLLASHAHQRQTRRNAETESIELQTRSATGTHVYTNGATWLPLKVAHYREGD